MNRFCCLLLLVSCVLNFTGCTTRPPSAVQFMETYRRSMELKEKPDAYVDFGFSLLGSFPAIICQRDVSWKSVCNAENEYADQLPYDLSGQMTVLMDSHFLIGAELHYIDLNFFVGTAFEHFGVMGWVDAVGSVADKTPGIGLMIMEQFPIGDIVSWGIMQHVQQGVTIGTYHSDRYLEVGGGAYILGKGNGHKGHWSVGLELLYGVKVKDGTGHIDLRLSVL